jgi:hypothetical protein
VGKAQFDAADGFHLYRTPSPNHPRMSSSPDKVRKPLADQGNTFILKDISFKIS